MNFNQLAKGFPFDDIEYSITELKQQGYEPRCAHDSESPDLKEELQMLKNQGISYELKPGKHHQLHVWCKKS